MSTAHAVQTALEILAVLALVVGVAFEKKLIRFEDRVWGALKRRQRKKAERKRREAAYRDRYAVDLLGRRR
jgi:hypothetical protein